MKRFYQIFILYTKNFSFIPKHSTSHLEVFGLKKKTTQFHCENVYDEQIAVSK